MSEHLDDRLEFDAPFDAGQWALHGLLWAYYVRARGDDGRRAEAILAHVARMPVRASLSKTATSALGALLRHRRWVLGGSLAAAVILLAMYATYAPTARDHRGGRSFDWPDIAAPAEAAVMMPTPPTSFGSLLMLCGLDLGDESSETTKNVARDDARRANRPLLALLHTVNCGEVEERLAAIDAARAKRDEYLADMAVGCEYTVTAGQSTFDALMSTWADGIFRPLRDLGRFQEALDEVHRAIDFTAGNNPTGDTRPGWYCAMLNELAVTLEAMGDYDAARAAHLDSIAARFGDYGSPAVDDGGWRATIPFVSPYLSLSWLAVLRDGRAGLSDAWNWQHQAETALRRYFAAICETYDIAVPSTASAFEIFRRLPEEFQAPPEEGYRGIGEEGARARYRSWLPAASVVAWLRAELYNEIRLRRFDGDYAGAAVTLDRIATLPVYRYVDEWRLDYWVPVEAARVAILRGDYRGALAQLEVASKNGGAAARPVAWLYDERAVGPLALVDVELLRGVALLGASPDSSGGRQTIRDALAVLERLADDMPAAQRESFKSRFRVWNELAVAAR